MIDINITSIVNEQFRKVADIIVKKHNIENFEIVLSQSEAKEIMYYINSANSLIESLYKIIEVQIHQQNQYAEKSRKHIQILSNYVKAQKRKQGG
jgi:hypothetical protein